MAASGLSMLEAIILGAVEGITEFLPVSSTGHLLVVERLLGLDSGPYADSAETYAIAIQFGAILAVTLLYRSRLLQMLRGVIGRDPTGRRITVRLLLAFLPAAIIGIGFGDAIRGRLFDTVPVAVAWIAGGVFLLWWRGGAAGAADGGALDRISMQSAVVVGCAQTLALWPGVSRSLVTLVAGVAIGLSLSAAVEFSFLLGLMTLSAASLYDVARHGSELVDEFGIATPLVGGVVALITATVAVRWLVGFVSRGGLRLFGWYRLTVGVAALALVGVGVL